MENPLRKLGRILRGTPAKGQPGSGASIASGQWSTDKAPDISTSQKRADAFLRAYKTDSRVSQAVDEHLATLSTGTWLVEPGVDTEDNQAAAEFVSAVLFGNESDKFGRDYWCRPVWPQRRYELGFSLLVYGYAIYHKVYKRVGAYQVLDKLTYIEPSTITLWQLDAKDDLELIQRTYTKGDETHVVNEELVAKDLVLYTHRLVGANYEGISLVRTLYPAFARKEFLEKLKMIAGKRLFSPVPVMKVPADIRPGSEGWSRIEAFLQAMTNPNVDTAYFMGSELPEYLQPDSVEALKELAQWIKDENQEEAAVGGNKGMTLGEDTTGSYALGGTVSARETLKHNALAEDIVTLENFGIAGLNSLITELVQLNFPSVKIMPYLCFIPAGTDEALKGASVFADLAAKKVLHVTAADEMKIREAIGYDDGITEDDIQKLMDEDKALAEKAMQATAPTQTKEAVPPTDGNQDA